jgi:hypothetical protein
MSRRTTATYAKIRFEPDEIEIALRALRQASDTARANLAMAEDLDERAFHAEADSWAVGQVAAIMAATSGRVAFTERDLLAVKAQIASVLRPALVGRWQSARDTGSAEADKLSAEIDAVEALISKLERPFVADRSQDAEEEDEQDRG